jgi:alpha-mannosidase
VPVELEIGRLLPSDTLHDDEGQEVALQAGRSLATVGAWRNRPCFVAELPPMGYRVYRLKAGAEDTPHTVPPQPEPCVIENERLRLRLDPDTGHITSLYDKHAGHEVFRGPGAAPAVLRDESDTWSHGVSAYDDLVGTFGTAQVRLVEHGSVRSVLRAVSSYGASRLTQEFTLYPGIDRVEVRVAVDWRERWKLLRLQFPLNLMSTRATYETPYGHIERAATGTEEAGLAWADISGTVRDTGAAYGLSLCNDAKYSYSARENELRLTVLRSPIYAHHDPYVPEPDGEYTWMDQGVQGFSYWLLPHEGTWKQAGTARRAAELCQRPVALVETYHDGPLPLSASFLAVDAVNVVVGAMKQAEDSEDLIVRCYETHGATAKARIELGAWRRTIDAEFSPYEIKTFRVPADPALPVTETSMLEWELGS